MTTAPEAPTVTPDGVTTRQLLESLLAATGRQTATKAVVDDLRAELRRRADAHVLREGTAPRWSVKGVGSALLTDPEDRVVVGDAQAFAEWAAQTAPEHVVATLLVPATALEAVLEALDGVLDPEDRPVRLDADPKWTADVIAGAVVFPAEPGEAPQVGSEHGELVPGLKVTRTAASLSVKLDPEAKARAAAEHTSPALLARLTAPLPPAEDDLPGDVVHQLTAKE